MSWLFEPKKDVAVNDIVGEVTSNLRSGGFRMGKPSFKEAFLRESGEPPELKHLSKVRKKNRV